MPRARPMMEAYVPLQIGAAHEHFALGVVVPRAVLMREARAVLWTVVAVGALGASLLCGAVFWLLRRQVGVPLARAVRVADDIGQRQAGQPDRCRPRRRDRRP